MFTFKISPDGGESFTVRGTSRDIHRWEKTTKGASLHKLQEEMTVSALYEVAFHACKRAGLWDGTLAEFEAQCDIDTVDDEDDDSEDPSPSAA